jgi:hypothetical protein
MVWHYLHFQNLASCLTNYFPQDFVESDIYAVDQNWATVFGTPDNVILA